MRVLSLVALLLAAQQSACVKLRGRMQQQSVLEEAMVMKSEQVPAATITVKSAFYGRDVNGNVACPHQYSAVPSKACKRDITGTTNGNAGAFALCNGKNKCTVAARNPVWGDPCPDTYKFTQVEYTCSNDAPGVVRTGRACESTDGALTIDCGLPTPNVGSKKARYLEISYGSGNNGVARSLHLGGVYAYTESGANIINSKMVTTAKDTFPWANFPVSYLVDTDENTMYHSSSTSEFPWARIDFGQEFDIARIVLANRKDCCTDRLAGAVVKLYAADNSLVYTSSPVTHKDATTTYRTNVSPDAAYFTLWPGYNTQVTGSDTFPANATPCGAGATFKDGQCWCPAGQAYDASSFRCVTAPTCSITGLSGCAGCFSAISSWTPIANGYAPPTDPLKDNLYLRIQSTGVNAGLNFNARDNTVVYHLNPRFTGDSQSPTLVQNTMNRGTWQSEDRSTTPYSLHMYTNFPSRIYLQSTKDAFILSRGDGQQTFRYNNRLSGTEVTSLSLNGWASVERADFVSQCSACDVAKGFAPVPAGGQCRCKEGFVLAGDVCVKDCVVSEWTDFSECSAKCGGGQQTRTRTIREQPENGGKACPANLEEIQGCNVDACPVNCEVSDWSNWGECSAVCGGGQQTRHRNVQTNAMHGGNECPADMEQVQGCNVDPCPIDCVMSEWAAWEVCTATCGGGKQARIRGVIQEAQFGGAACPSDILESQPCNMEACPVDCEVSEWSQWSECSAQCGFATKTRTRTQVREASNGGRQCPELSEIKDCLDLPSCETTTSTTTTTTSSVDPTTPAPETTTAAATTTTTTLPAFSGSLGCYANMGTSAGTRPVFYMKLKELSGMTVDTCYANCAGYNYFGLINGNQCACANATTSTAAFTYTTYGTSTACANGLGGKNAVDVYKRNY